ncbi:MAG: hypothetical protein AB7F28_08745 [Candidatus Margulisiibacteriota bacterium]
MTKTKKQQPQKIDDKKLKETFLKLIKWWSSNPSFHSIEKIKPDLNYICSLRSNWLTLSETLQRTIIMYDMWGDAPFDNEEQEKIADNLTEWVKSLPIKYELAFPFPNLDLLFLEDSKSLEIAPHLSIRFSSDSYSSKTRFVVLTEGYVEGPGNATFQNALIPYKTFIEWCCIKGLFEKTFKPQKLETEVHTKEKANGPSRYDDLPKVTWGFIENLKVNWEGLNDSEVHTAIKKLLKVKEQTSVRDKFQNLLAPLRWPENYNSKSIQEKYQKQLQTALYWGFEARSFKHSGSISNAIIYLASAFEAILGDHYSEKSSQSDSDLGLTTLMAERCAYLIGSKHSEREKIRKDFRAFYRLRSKVVHGVQIEMEEKDNDIFREARQLFDRVILKSME